MPKKPNYGWDRNRKEQSRKAKKDAKLAERQQRRDEKAERANAVSDVVRREITKRFSPTDAPTLLGLLELTELPMLEEAEYQRDRDRVQLAILKILDGDIGNVHAALRLASIDWRDTLVAAGLANENWPQVLEAAGYPKI